MFRNLRRTLKYNFNGSLCVQAKLIKAELGQDDKISPNYYDSYYDYGLVFTSIYHNKEIVSGNSDLVSHIVLKSHLTCLTYLIIMT